MNKITVETVVNASLTRVWDCWTLPEHITKWAFASSDWEALDAENNVQVGGQFNTLLSAKDNTESFEFKGTYTAVKKHTLLEYTLEDDRKVCITFIQTSSGVKITETFDPEAENTEEEQRVGWQAFLDNFKKHVESCT